MKKELKYFLIAIFYIIFGVASRTVIHIAPNVEFVTALSISGAFLLRKGYGISALIGMMVISDLIIGNSNIFIFTWSAFVLIFLIGKLLSKIKTNSSILRNLLIPEAGGIISTIFFSLWTNAGVVLMTNMYPKNIEGLLLSYKMGLPFLWPQLLGNLVIVPAVFVLTKFILKTLPRFNFVMLYK